jgi:hypothetical protein
MAAFTTAISSGTMTVTVPNVRRDQLPFFNLSAALAEAAVTVAVVFVDEAGDEVDCDAINLDTDGDVCCHPAGASDANAETLYLIKGEWHRMRFSKVFVSNTDAGLSARVRFLS